MTNVPFVGKNMIETNISERPDCEIKGVVGQSGDATPCRLKAKRRVCVEGLSDVLTCDFHGREMKKFWSYFYHVHVVPL